MLSSIKKETPLKRHILVVDDNPIDLQAVSAILESEGHIVIPAKDSYDALDKVAKYHIDMIISDINMPKLNGFDLLKTILNNATEEKPAPPMILMSGARKDSDDIKKSISLGAQDFLVKPVDPDVLMEKIKRSLNNQPVFSELPFEKDEDSDLDEILITSVGHVTTVSEMGMRLWSPVKLKIKSQPKIKTKFLEEIGINPPALKVYDCKPSTNDGFDVYISFVGLSEPDLQKIRQFCQKLVARRYDMSGKQLKKA